MRKFLVKTTLFSSAFLLFLISLFVINRCFANFGIDSDKKILIAGNSLPECAFNDALIPQAANFSQSGEAYFYTYFKTQQILKQNPQIDKVLIGFTNEHVKKNMDNWIWDDKYISYLFPLYAPFMNKDAIKLLIKNNSQKVRETIPILSKMNANMLFHYQLDYTITTGGYQSLEKCLVDSILNVRTDTYNERIYTEDTLAIKNLEYLDKLVGYCEQKGVQVFFVRTPLHTEHTRYLNEELFHELRQNKYPNVEFLDFSKYPLTNSEFADLVHLNNKGSEKFSLWFAELIKNKLFDKQDKQNFINEEIGLLTKY